MDTYGKVIDTAAWWHAWHVSVWADGDVTIRLWTDDLVAVEEMVVEVERLIARGQTLDSEGRFI